MIRSNRKIAAVFLAIWLPLFSGNALAASVAMTAMNGDRHSLAMQPDEQHAHHVAAGQQHEPHHDNQAAAAQEAVSHESGQHGQPNTPCHDCGVCHFACSGYLATLAVKVNEARLLTRTYTNATPQFQSFTSAPLDPPPLARV